MATVQSLLDDINLRYKNTFTTAQIVVWMNDCQLELFESLRLDSTPYSFTTVSGQFFYPIPSGVEIEKIKTMTLQMNTSSPAYYNEVPFLRNDDGQYVDASALFYTLVENNFYLNIPGGAVTGWNVYIYCDQSEVDITATNLNVEPGIPTKYQDLLKIGTLERIAGARKDVLMKNNYESDFEQKLGDFLWDMKMNEPEFETPIDKRPRSRRSGFGSSWVNGC